MLPFPTSRHQAAKFFSIVLSHICLGLFPSLGLATEAVALCVINSGKEGEFTHGQC